MTTGSFARVASRGGRRSSVFGPYVYKRWHWAHARLAGIPCDRIVNCWPFERFRRWLCEPASER
jgi:hypothetical protein